jgi:hypothetical protein
MPPTAAIPAAVPSCEISGELSGDIERATLYASSGAPRPIALIHDRVRVTWSELEAGSLSMQANVYVDGLVMVGGRMLFRDPPTFFLNERVELRPRQHWLNPGLKISWNEVRRVVGARLDVGLRTWLESPARLEFSVGCEQLIYDWRGPSVPDVPPKGSSTWWIAETSLDVRLAPGGVVFLQVRVAPARRQHLLLHKHDERDGFARIIFSPVEGNVVDGWVLATQLVAASPPTHGRLPFGGVKATPPRVRREFHRTTVASLSRDADLFVGATRNELPIGTVAKGALVRVHEAGEYTSFNFVTGVVQPAPEQLFWVVGSALHEQKNIRDREEYEQLVERESRRVSLPSRTAESNP